MFGEFDSLSDFDDAGLLEALGQLEQNTTDEILRQRSSQRLAIRTAVLIQPGNASQRNSTSVKGLTGDISNGGCLILAKQPLMVGDIFWLTFSDEDVTIGSLLARCMRSRLVREDSFEMGFRFFEDIDLATSLKPDRSSTK